MLTNIRVRAIGDYLLFRGEVTVVLRDQYNSTSGWLVIKILEYDWMEYWNSNIPI